MARPRSLSFDGSVRPTATRRGCRRAFTLVEVAAVLIVLAIALLVALPSVESSHRTYLLQSGASRVMAALQTAQSEAVASGVDHGVEFSTADNTLRCIQMVGSPPYPIITHPVLKTPYSVDFDTAPGLGGITLTGVTFPESRVVFDSLGSPNNGGTVTVSLGLYARSVEMAAVSGLMEFRDP